MKHSLMMLLGMALAAVVNADGDLGGKTDRDVTRVPFDEGKWTLVWADEFDTPGAPDPAKWALEEGYLRNNEEQYYTKGRLENARVEGGKLIIEARRDHWQGKPITSASLTTLGRRVFLYGRVAVRAKIPTGRGTWPAIWTLGLPPAGEPRPDWPGCGEIDIMENVGKDPARIHANIHCAAYNHMKRNGRGNSITAPAPWEDFHEYAVEWHPDRLEFFFDDQRYFVYRKEGDDTAVWPYATPHYLILNLAIGGAWGGEVDVALLPHRFEVDYVRYYQARR
ncbi:MAG: glycoside hydrolase family 16 protein [Verrucomicrobiales bacterium]|jgi:beta-glucanase (GH16 family)|nr:glycoside hydrolase family 16 protein [Verrucomicrobiales bacterium]